MQWYNPSTDQMEDKIFLYMWYFKFMKRKFYFKVWLLKKIIRYFGRNIMNEIIGVQKVNANDMFLGKYVDYKTPRGRPLV